MLVENNAYRRKPSPIDKPAEPWRRELHTYERNRADAQERATEATKRREETRARWTALLASASADFEHVRELGKKTHGVDPRWARQLSERLQGRIAAIVRMLDEDKLGLLQVDEMSRPVRQAVERVLAQRQRIQADLLED
jgi:hypothetical protein